MADTRLLLPLQIGHESEMLDTLTACGQTQFRWTVFVRSAGSLQFTDRSIINKVMFELHTDFPNPKRVVKEPPFEVTETGYGSFVIPVHISFTGVSKTYRVPYDLNLVLEKQSKHCVEHILLIKQPSKEFYELAMKYGARDKNEKKKKEKPDSGQDHITDAECEKNGFTAKNQPKRKRKTYLDNVKAGTSTGLSVSADCRAAVPTTSVVAAKNFTPRKKQKPFDEEAEKDEKPKNLTNGSRLTPPSDRSRGSTNGRSSPAVDRLKMLAVAKASPLKDRSKSATSGRSTPSIDKPKSSNKMSPSIERPKSAMKEKSNPPERPKSIVNEKDSSASESSKNFSDDQSPPLKRRKEEVSFDKMLSVQKSLMDISDANVMLAVLDALISSPDWPIPGLEYSDATKLLSFDLFALNPSLVIKLEKLCRPLAE